MKAGTVVKLELSPTRDIKKGFYKVIQSGNRVYCLIRKVNGKTFKEPEEPRLKDKCYIMRSTLEGAKIVGYVCAHCGKKVDGSISDRNRIVCKDCAKNYRYTCAHCGETYYDDVSSKVDEKILCHTCRFSDEITFICPSCGNAHLKENGYVSGGKTWCSKKCKERFHLYNTELLNYDNKPDLVFYGKDEDIKMGVELECDGSNEVSECIEDLSIISGKHICKEDGSLDQGFEIVTQPMSLEYHMKNFPWEKICDRVLGYGFKSDQAGTCGLHIHVDRSYFKDSRSAAVKFMLLINKHKEEFLKFSRRFDSQMQWCHILDISNLNDADAYECIGRERYHAINVHNTHTLEFRLWKGSLNVETIFATLQMTQVLCDIVKEFEDDNERIRNMSWEDICEYGADYKELQSYLRRRGLNNSLQQEIA